MIIRSISSKHRTFTVCFYGFLFSILILSCSSTKFPSGGQVTIPEDFFGIVHAARTRKAEEYKLLEQMECKWVLNTFYWSSIEPEKDTFNFVNYDLFVSGAKNHGLKIVGVLGYSANYLYPKGRARNYISPENMPFFLRFVEETVRHYKGQVDVWCIWNEPNIRFWKGSNSEYYELTKLAADKIRETDPNVYIIGGAFCRSPAGFIKKMHKAGAIKELDALSFHPYDLNPSGSLRIYDNFTKTLSEIDYAGPVWVTEVGFPTGGWYPNRVSENKFPAYIVKTITGMAARGARVLLWYHMFDSLDVGKKNLDSENYFGLIHKDFSRKAGSWAYELCARFLPGSRYVPELPQKENIPSNIVSFCFLDGISGNNTLIIWNDKKRIQKIEFNISSPALLHDISTGQNNLLSSNAFLDVGDKPLIITWQGTDTPRITKI
ncbi:MAG: beta-galactosidase [Treponema sp.]|nr:beta-galactosidase [Treponema sp.]